MMRGQNPDFEITSIGLFGGNPYISVLGIAGRTIPHSHQGGDRPHTHADMELPHTHRSYELIYGYAIYTDTGVWLANAHDFSHGGASGEDKWHCEKITFEDFGTPTMITSAQNLGRIAFDGNTVMFSETGARKVYRAITMSLEHLKMPGMVARVTEIFDVKYAS